MQKRLIVYSIAQEKVREVFESAVHEIDMDTLRVIDGHACVFRSDKTKDELFDIFHRIEIDTSKDEFWIFTLTDSFTGFGMALDDLKKFFISA